ncbi:MAG: two-component system NtrC family sensor kinase, partial [Psychroserpens sp.]
MKNILISVACVVFFSATVSATISTNVNIKSSSSRLDSSMSFVSINNFNIDSILSYNNYEDVGGTIISSGMSKETLVVRFTITNNLGNDRIYIKVPLVIVDSITLFDVTNNAYVLSGASIPREERVYDDPYCIFPININRGSSSEFLLVVSTEFPFVSPIEIKSAEDLTAEIGFRNLYLGIFSGVMLLMFAYNFILLILTKDRNYFYYIGYIFFIFMAQSNFLGVSYYLLGDFPLINNSLFYFGSGLSGIFGCLFLRNFLFTKTNVPILDKGLSILILLYIVQIVFTIFGYYFFSTILIQAIGALVVIVFGIIAIYLTIKNIAYARFYLIAWTPLLIGLITLILRDNGLLPYNSITTYLFSVGILLETVLLSLALADQINT